MITAAIAAVIARPTTKLSESRQVISLEDTVPRHFGDWREDSSRPLQLVNPQQLELLDRLYRQVLNRTYANAQGYRIMLSLAYGDDQRERGSLQLHKPEVCYPAQGFVIHANQPGLLATPAGNIPVRRLFASMEARQEPLTYWITIGDTAIAGSLQKRLLDLRYGLTGLIPDGLLVRVSSIDPVPARAYQMQDEFINQLLQSISPADRKRLSGIGNQ
jgi:EpsI family protein